MEASNELIKTTIRYNVYWQTVENRSALESKHFSPKRVFLPALGGFKLLIVVLMVNNVRFNICTSQKMSRPIFFQCHWLVVYVREPGPFFLLCQLHFIITCFLSTRSLGLISVLCKTGLINRLSAYQAQKSVREPA